MLSVALSIVHWLSTFNFAPNVLGVLENQPSFLQSVHCLLYYWPCHSTLWCTTQCPSLLGVMLSVVLSVNYTICSHNTSLLGVKLIVKCKCFDTVPYTVHFLLYYWPNALLNVMLIVKYNICKYTVMPILAQCSLWCSLSSVTPRVSHCGPVHCSYISWHCHNGAYS